jgi:hypothetical protein
MNTLLNIVGVYLSLGCGATFGYLLRERKSMPISEVALLIFTWPRIFIHIELK